MDSQLKTKIFTMLLISKKLQENKLSNYFIKQFVRKMFLFKRSPLTKSLHNCGNLSIRKLRVNKVNFWNFFNQSMTKSSKLVILNCIRTQILKWMKKTKKIYWKCLEIKLLDQQNYFIELHKTIFKQINFIRNVTIFLTHWLYAKQFMVKWLEGIRH